MIERISSWFRRYTPGVVVETKPCCFKQRVNGIACLNLVNIININVKTYRWVEICKILSIIFSRKWEKKMFFY